VVVWLSGYGFNLIYRYPQVVRRRVSGSSCQDPGRRRLARTSGDCRRSARRAVAVGRRPPSRSTPVRHSETQRGTCRASQTPRFPPTARTNHGSSWIPRVYGTRHGC
jgi:hypothetical protein